MAELEGVNADEFGKIIQLYCKKDGTVQDISGFSAITVKFRSPAPVKRIQVSADYTSTGQGADGVVEFQFTSDIYPDRAGDWSGQVWMFDSTSSPNRLYKSKKFIMEVGE